MAQVGSTDWDFIFDGVMGYLTSPMWQIPIASFIDKNCLVFDPSEENCLSWKDVHTQYKTMVEDLLSSYLQDVGITEEQFVKACSSKRMQETSRMQAVFEQIWAAEDFEVFKRMMVQKNVELELQALQLIQQRQGRGTIKDQQSNPRNMRLLDEDDILKEVMRQSKEEYERCESMKDEKKKYFNAKLEKIIASSEAENERLKAEATKQEQQMKNTVSESIAKGLEEQTPGNALYPDLLAGTSEMHVSPKENDVSREDVKSSKVPKDKQNKKELAPVKSSRHQEPVVTKSKEPQAKSDAASEWLKNAKDESAKSSQSTSAGKGGIGTEEDIKAREKYLKEQRDRLLAMKKQEREKRLEAYSTSQPARPTSARVARNVVTEGKADKSGDKETQSSVDPKKLAMRRALAERLKKEVVNK